MKPDDPNTAKAAFIFPPRLRRRQLALVLFFSLSGILWLLAPRTEELSGALVLFLGLIVSALVWSWLMLPVSLDMEGRNITVRTLLSVRSFSPEELEAVSQVERPLWWGRSYPALLLRCRRPHILLAGYRKDQPEWKALQQALESFMRREDSSAGDAAQTD